MRLTSRKRARTCKCTAKQIVALIVSAVTTRTTTTRKTEMAISSYRCSAYAGVRANNWCSETEISTFVSKN